MLMPSRAFFPIARSNVSWDSLPMENEDAFITGLRDFFDRNPDCKPATVSAAAGLNKSAIRKLLDGQVKSPRHQSMTAIASALGTTIDDIITGSAEYKPGNSLAVAGRVGAGAIVHLVDDHAKGDGLYHIECPSIISPHGIVGVEVEGDSMAPHYHPGDVLLYSRDTVGVPTEAIGRICVCEDTDGRAWVKTVRIGSEEGTFSLISVNPSAENRHGVRLKWAAPVRLHLPSEYVVKT